MQNIRSPVQQLWRGRNGYGGMRSSGAKFDFDLTSMVAIDLGLYIYTLSSDPYTIREYTIIPSKPSWV